MSGPTRRGGDIGLWTLGALCLISGAAVLWRDGVGAFETILIDDALLIAAIAPKLIGAVLLVAWLRLLIPKERVADWFGADSGFGGLLRATLGGALTPGGPAAAYPVVSALTRMGADQGVAIAFVSGWLLLGASRVLIWELAFLDAVFVANRLLLSLPAAIAIGFAARLLWRREAGR